MTPTAVAGHRFTVFGAGGFIGRRAAALLRERGAEVFTPARPWTAQAGQELGHVLFCAGLTADYLARPLDTVDAHVHLLGQVLRHGRFQSLVYCSSTRLYDGLSGAESAHEDLALPMVPTNPRHLYDLSKALGESLCHVLGQGRARVARLACVYDLSDDPDGFLPAVVRQAQAALRQGQASVLVDTSASLVRDYVHRDDVVEALVRIALHGVQPAYNVASGNNVSNQELFGWIDSTLGVRLVPQRPPAAVPPAPRVDIQRLREGLAWHPRSVDAWLRTVPI